MKMGNNICKIRKKNEKWKKSKIRKKMTMKKNSKIRKNENENTILEK